MDNLITETNARLSEIIENLTTIKEEYESKLEANNKDIDEELAKVKKYKEEFFVSKQKIEKMNSDIEGFEEDYKKLVERFKDDELANILIAANKEISTKIDERRKKIAKDKVAMNELVELAENSKNKLVKLTAEKKALELCLAKILDSHEYYTKSLTPIISYSEEHRNDLSSCFYDENAITPLMGDKEETNFISKNEETEDVLYEEDDAIDFDSDVVVTESDLEEIGLDLEDELVVEDAINFDDDVEETEEIVVNDEEDEIDEEDVTEEIDEESELYQENDEEEFDEEDESIENEIEDELVQEDEIVEEDIVTEDEDILELDDIPSSLYDLNDSLDLETLLEIDSNEKEDE